MKHPAKFTDSILATLAQVVDEYPHRQRGAVRVLDPFAGVGRVHELERMCDRDVDTLGVELMPKWAATHVRTMRGDATMLPRDWTGRFDLVVTSPCYGNRFADHHEATDTCKTCKGTGYTKPIGDDGMIQVDPTHRVPKRYAHEARCAKCDGTGISSRRSYRHDYEASGGDFLADAPIEQNAGAMHWGDDYRALHERAWSEVRRVLRPRGRFVLNIKDHIKDGERVHVARWHKRTAVALGFVEVETWQIDVNGLGHGAHRDARVDHEYVYVLEKG